MKNKNYLSDFDHPIIKKKAAELTQGIQTPLEKIESIFYFIRDGIRFVDLRGQVYAFDKSSFLISE